MPPNEQPMTATFVGSTYVWVRQPGKLVIELRPVKELHGQAVASLGAIERAGLVDLVDDVGAGGRAVPPSDRREHDEAGGYEQRRDPVELTLAGVSFTSVVPHDGGKRAGAGWPIDEPLQDRSAAGERHPVPVHTGSRRTYRRGRRTDAVRSGARTSIYEHHGRKRSIPVGRTWRTQRGATSTPMSRSSGVRSPHEPREPAVPVHGFVAEPEDLESSSHGVLHLGAILADLEIVDQQPCTGPRKLKDLG